METLGGRALAVLLLLWSRPTPGIAQDLTPRAYLLTPVSSNAVTLTYAFSKGDITFDPTLPITDARGTIHTPVTSYYHAFDFFGRSANISGSLAWANGNFSATVAGTGRDAHRQGLMDSTVRFAVNLLGGPALSLGEYVKTPPATNVLGASVRVVAPTGQYVKTRAINPGANRWAFKSEIGFSHRFKRLIVDAYGGVWLFTENDDYLAPSPDVPGSVRQQSPIGSFEGHVSYDVKPRFWVSLDANYWRGGQTTVNGVRSLTSLQSNSRLGVTGAVPFSSHQSLKCSYSDGVITRVGGRFRVFSAAWQYSWVGRPFRRTS
jgi:hypothetical protein